MLNRRRFAMQGVGALMLPAWAYAQSNRPMRIVVPFGAGGIADLTARAVANKLAENLHQPVIVDNRPGAGGVIAGDVVAKSEPDGLTLLLMSNGTAVSAGLFKSLPFDAQKDFAPIATIGTFDIAIVTAAASRFRTLGEMLAYARANPGKLNVATISIGSTQHLAAELLKSSAGVDLQVVPFKNSPEVLAALRGGQVDAAVEILGPLMAQVTARTVHPLAVMGARRSRSLPDVPTVAESGVAGFDVSSWNALAAPARTPAAVIARLNREVQKAVADPQVQKQLDQLGVTPASGSPEQLAALLASEIKRWSGVIVRAKVPRQ